MHNIDLSRIPNPTEKDIQRVEKYKKILSELEKTFFNGEQPGKGTYYCTSCGEAVTISNTAECLFRCFNCDNITYVKKIRT